MRLLGSTIFVLVAFLVLASPSTVSAALYPSLVWGETIIQDGGTYSVQINETRPTYVPPNLDVFDIIGNLYKVNGSERDFVESFITGPAPEDGDELFAWTTPGSYELEILELPPPVLFSFETQFVEEPTLLTTIHFTIVDENATPDPVIIIPGILGSEQHNGQWIIDPILHTYDDLIATLDANGYTPDIDLFTFPYNWRKSNVETALLLKEKIDDVKAICGCDKADLVAHSMGGLVARQYIQSDAYGDDVDQLIFLGTPHLGAPKAYLMWEGGEISPANDLTDELLELLLEHEAHEEGYANLFQYIQARPIKSVEQLLPVYDYIFDENSLRSYPDNYPRNLFLETLRDNLSRLQNSSVRTYNVIGRIEMQETINGLQVVKNDQFAPKWSHGYPENFYNVLGNHGLIFGGGDKTVPTASASSVSDNSIIIPYLHGALPLEAEGYVVKNLTGNDAISTSRVYAGFDLANLLIFKILSPADLLVIDPNGNKIGKDFNGQEVNEILNAFYTGFNTDTEFITILNPLDGEYKIYTQGTGSGLYTVETSFITNATTTDSSFTGNTAPGIIAELNLGVQDNGIAPDALDVVVTYESTLADLETINTLGWINKGVYKALKAQLQAAKKVPPKVAKKLLRAILKQLKVYRGKMFTAQAYQILKADIEQLLKIYL